MTAPPVTPFITGTPEPTYDLKYLFEVEFRNGARYLQNARDVSAFDAKRTPWHDIEAERLQPMAEIAALSLFDADTHVAVNLDDGWLTVNDVRVWCCDTLSYLPPKTALQAYYARDVRRRWKVGYGIQSGKPETRQFDGLFVQYVIGWDAIIDGTAHKARLAVE